MRQMLLYHCAKPPTKLHTEGVKFAVYDCPCWYLEVRMVSVT